MLQNFKTSFVINKGTSYTMEQTELESAFKLSMKFT